MDNLREEIKRDNITYRTAMGDLISAQLCLVNKIMYLKKRNGDVPPELYVANRALAGAIETLNDYIRYEG